MIHGLKVLRHAKGEAVVMPQRKWKKAGQYTIAYPSTAEGSPAKLVRLSYSNLTRMRQGC
jgi:DNA-binding cell septation regulator SpoVG